MVAVFILFFRFFLFFFLLFSFFEICLDYYMKINTVCLCCILLVTLTQIHRSVVTTMINKLVAGACVFICLLSAIKTADAHIQVSPMNITLTSANQYSGAVRVFSNSDEPQYIQTSVKRIINPGTSQQQEVSISPDEGAGIVVSPQRFILSGQGSHLVRILPVNIPQKEGVYRVYISAIPDDTTGQAGIKEKKAQVTINVIWGVLVYVTPEHKNVSFSYNAATGELTNTGNAHVRVSAYGFCHSKYNCQWRSLNRTIYPDMSYNIPGRSEDGRSFFIKYQSEQAQTILKVD
ncbi:hypothetical protein EWD33_22085 [Salmonella enterica subsp. enterica serovar Oranienburg]|nr:hypothetical protein [Salmonella enterica subsp. enterica serovar Oranienburg]